MWHPVKRNVLKPVPLHRNAIPVVGEFIYPFGNI
jgi:hypothetical protein